MLQIWQKVVWKELYDFKRLNFIICLQIIFKIPNPRPHKCNIYSTLPPSSPHSVLCSSYSARSLHVDAKWRVLFQWGIYRFLRRGFYVVVCYQIVNGLTVILKKIWEGLLQLFAVPVKKCRTWDVISLNCRNIITNFLFKFFSLIRRVPNRARFFKQFESLLLTISQSCQVAADCDTPFLLWVFFLY